MSSVFSIADTEFDDLEDEGFLIEVCNLDAPKSENIGVSNLRTTGNDETESKPSTLRSFGSGTSQSSFLRNSSTLLRTSEASVKNKTVYRSNDGGNRQQQAVELPQKRTMPHTNGNMNHSNIPHNKESALNNRQNNEWTDELQCDNNASHFKRRKSSDGDNNLISSSITPQHHNTPKTSSSNAIKSGTSCNGLRYTQNAQFSGPLNLNTKVQQGSAQSTPMRNIAQNRTCLEQQSCDQHLSRDSQSSTFQTPVRNTTRVTGGDNMPGNLRQSGSCLRESAAATENRTPLRGNASTPKTRRFPGPAGLLPRLEPGQSLDNVPSPFAETPKKKSPEICQIVCQIKNAENDHDFYTNPWTTMQDEINKRFHTPLDSLTLVIRKATTQQLDNGKVSFLAVLVKSFNPTGLDASVVLKDPSGEMRGTLHKKVLEEHQLEPGCGLFLKQVSVFSPSPRKHYLNITPGNIVEIFPVSSEEFASPDKASHTTPKRRPQQIESEPSNERSREPSTHRSSEPSSETSNQPSTAKQLAEKNDVCEDNFDDLLQGLDSDDDILAEAMCF